MFHFLIQILTALRCLGAIKYLVIKIILCNPHKSLNCWLFRSFRFNIPVFSISGNKQNSGKIRFLSILLIRPSLHFSHIFNCVQETNIFIRRHCIECVLIYHLCILRFLGSQRDFVHDQKWLLLIRNKASWSCWI